MKNESAEHIVKKLTTLKIRNHNRLKKLKNKFAAKYKSPIVTNADLLSVYRKMVKQKKIKTDDSIEKLLRKRAIRTMSGVAPIAVLTKHYECPGNCVFCPSEKEMPKSYLSNEPAVMRAILNKFNPYEQVKTRLRALYQNGHNTDKIELIVMGGTFNFFPRQYQTWYIKRCFDACNKRTAKNLAEAQKWNEKAKHRIVGLTLETRPDYINEKELANFRRLGCTRVEIGVQAIDDKILKKNNRQSTVADIIKATKLMKQSGFKVAYHMMPNLPGATVNKDFKMFEELFHNPDFQPDMLKIYPTVVTDNSKLYNWWKKGLYKPYTDKQLLDLLIKIKMIIPRYVRIIRLIRDIPKESIEAGNMITNLRQIISDKLKVEDIYCKCIRCREARDNTKNAHKARFYVEEYEASEGTEYFLHYSSYNKKILYAFCRLRLNKPMKHFIPELQDSAIIREVHTYGKLVSIDKKEGQTIQHLGFGRRLMIEAEAIAQKEGFTKISVISGIGVRGYYKKLGYKLDGTYMSKKLKNIRT